MSAPRVLLLEPFFDGSHRAFVETLMDRVSARWTLLTLPGRHWKWRMRGSAAHFAACPELRMAYDAVFATSFVPLAELAGLAPAIVSVPKILYFHENQLTYPVQQDQERDHHFGMTQLVSGLAADRLVFNSEFNRQSFLEAGARLLRRMPDAVRPDWIETLRARSQVLPVPLDLPPVAESVLRAEPSRRQGCPLIVWCHRWEHDKGPDDLARVMQALAAQGPPFRLALCGQHFRREPQALRRLKDTLGERLVHAGWLPRDGYEALLQQADIALSTAHQEFFGVAMLEAVHFGAEPLVPDRLVYPELYPDRYRYDASDLQAALQQRLRRWHEGRPSRAPRPELTERFGAPTWDRYRQLLEDAVTRSDFENR